MLWDRPGLHPDPRKYLTTKILANVASHLRRFVKPRLGSKIASDVTQQDIAQLSNDILGGKLGTPSVANGATCAGRSPGSTTGRPRPGLRA